MHVVSVDLLSISFWRFGGTCPAFMFRDLFFLIAGYTSEQLRHQPLPSVLDTYPDFQHRKLKLAFTVNPDSDREIITGCNRCDFFLWHFGKLVVE